MSVDLETALRGLSIDLRLTDMHNITERKGGRYRAMDEAWRGLTSLHNIDRAKVCKLLSLKRPKLFPILDSRIADIYTEAAAAEGTGLGSQRPHYWSAIAADVSADAGEFGGIRDRLRDDADTRHLSYLIDLRLQDTSPGRQPVSPHSADTSWCSPPVTEVRERVLMAFARRLTGAREHHFRGVPFVISRRGPSRCWSLRSLFHCRQLRILKLWLP